jgi:predicted nucleic acid-binding protein
VKEFVDTSVLVAAFWRGHPHHDASLKVVSAANKRKSACAAHTLAEVYATMTALPVKDVIPPEQALLFVQEIRDRFTIVSLGEDQYFQTIQEAAARGFVSGRVYDALLLQCAAKVKAETIYTWNLKHFRAIVPKALTGCARPDSA